ncbi:hypothetical protein [Sphingomonas hengshuiensis]|uniref:Sugar transporter n=1 Tax=Sphingomonas hengshuiensis TaxID=1609977 RepID=A0A7U4LFZ2_9SPHN|nr:hypothetical protein [Sphingomonas hengshuiensis]AJP72763.1 hypothetical protein TS85_14745 [Sphingomonas hengshuiensis]
MAFETRQSPSLWYWIAVALLVLWGLAGCFSFYLHLLYGAAMSPDATDWDRAYTAALPGWFSYDYAVAVGAGLLGSLALAARSRHALALYWASLAAVIVQFGYVFLATDMIAAKGVATAVSFPLFIVAIGIVQIALARHAARRGWIS